MNYSILFESGNVESWDVQSGKPGSLHVYNKSGQTLYWGDIPPAAGVFLGNLVTGSAVIQLAEYPSDIQQGMTVSGSSITAGAYVVSVDRDAKQVTMSVPSEGDEGDIDITFEGQPLTITNAMTLAPDAQIVFDDAAGSSVAGGAGKRFWFDEYDVGGNIVAFRRPDF